MKKYETLVKILDQITREAPHSLDQIYRPKVSETEKIDLARGRAYVHLYLKVSFGLLDFNDREELITDGAFDGGIDGYYIDSTAKHIYLIQSKFRTNSKNFDQANIGYEDLLKIDANRIIHANAKDENGNDYNPKIQKLIRQLGAIPDMPAYSYTVVLLSNVTPLASKKIKQLVGGLPVEIINHATAFKRLVFPVVNGTYYIGSDLNINIDLRNTNFQLARIKYNVKAEEVPCEIHVSFVPTLEIAKALYKYRNTILEHNPRSYLGYKQNQVNAAIRDSILEKKMNEFALYNNGITILADWARMSDAGKPNRAILTIREPQILNGGQTAFTLSEIYSELVESNGSLSVFNSKDVMLKVISIVGTKVPLWKRAALIEEISKATNQQSPVEDSDRRSSDEKLKRLQGAIYDDYGYFYERKRGEFHDGLKSGYIHHDMIIDRTTLARLAYAVSGRPVAARRNSINQFFTEPNYSEVFGQSGLHHLVMFAYYCLEKINEIAKELAKDRSDPHGFSRYGRGIQYGFWSIIYVAYKTLQTPVKRENAKSLAEHAVVDTLGKWLAFESWAHEQSANATYFRKTIDRTGAEVVEVDFANYYKGKTAQSDLNKHFKLSSSIKAKAI